MVKRVYFDYAATTPIRKEVLKAMLPFFKDNFGNPSSLHSFGKEAFQAVDESRELIKNILEADSSREIIFTSSVSESNNLAIKGLVFYTNFFKNFKPHIISSTIEHPSILETLTDLAEMNLIEVDYLKPAANSLINYEEIKNYLKDNTILLTLHYVNSELGTIQKIAEIAKMINFLNQERKNKVYFHLDAAQALTEDFSVKNLGADLMSFSSHKIYGPKGIALLYVKNTTPLVRLISGANQEYNLRAGTENSALIVGFAKALSMLYQEKNNYKSYLTEIRNYFLQNISRLKSKVELNTYLPNSSPKILNLFFPFKKSQDLMIYLNNKGIAVSAGTACRSRANEPSYVIKEIFGKERSLRSIRFSFGIFTTKAEVVYLFKCLNDFL